MSKHAYTLKEVADTLGLSEGTVRKLVDRGHLATVTIGRSVRVTHRQLDAFLSATEQTGSVVLREEN